MARISFYLACMGNKKSTHARSRYTTIHDTTILPRKPYSIRFIQEGVQSVYFVLSMRTIHDDKVLVVRRVRPRPLQ
jgi:hypothetical protein